MPREADLSEEQSRLTLDDFVVPGECDTASFPGYLKRSIVSKYVEGREKIGAIPERDWLPNLAAATLWYVETRTDAMSRSKTAGRSPGGRLPR